MVLRFFPHCDKMMHSSLYLLVLYTGLTLNYKIRILYIMVGREMNTD